MTCPRDQQGRDHRVRRWPPGLPETRVPVRPVERWPSTRLILQMARGEYIVGTPRMCGGCHSADERNPDGPLSGGTEFKDRRLGTIRASNLTPDSVTGLGTWSEADIVRALRSGQRKDGQVLAPVMPYLWLNRMSDGDAFAVARYLKSLPPVRNEVLQNPNLVFKVARLFLRPEVPVVVRAPARGPTAAYGNYLADHVALVRTAIRRVRAFATSMTTNSPTPAMQPRQRVSP